MHKDLIKFRVYYNAGSEKKMLPVLKAPVEAFMRQYPNIIGEASQNQNVIETRTVNNKKRPGAASLERAVKRRPAAQ